MHTSISPYYREKFKMQMQWSFSLGVFSNLGVTKSTLIALIVLGIITGNVTGFRCYECVETGDSTRDSRDANSCMNVIPQDRTTSCLKDSSSPFCLKIDGVRDGERVVVRVCAAREWQSVMRGTDRCMDARELNRKGRMNVKIDDGYVCICDADRCNHASTIKSPPPTLIFVFYAFLLIITTTTFYSPF